MNSLIAILAGFTGALIGGAPFGLVNLSVVAVTTTGHELKPPLMISLGASLVEIFFGATALILVSMFHGSIDSNPVIKIIIAIILAGAGATFLLRKKSISIHKTTSGNSLLQGAFLNLISLQMFIYWVIAVTFILQRGWISTGIDKFLFFATGILIGKMTILLFYIYLSKRILSRSAVISRNINTIVGAILILIAIVQIVK